ncbi:TM2 domain-containing protein [Paralcaligenes ureilyticus]|jgi:TM2 domain-containing membrane protein YozV|uniref:TM2 domain-containing protein n=1 Tax=Paralcaligenes ureilyticus TaxID=627131 RepID=A0A4V2UYT5_9BURK|nr:TM2 domain-containing protein [Paralcaligenes ureilyticus]TCT08668.1 TM2 domain-containing protein [Paralcaligenes ureilyticus]
MLQKIVLACVVFIIILIALTFGETIAHEFLAWVSYLTGLVIHNFSDVYYLVTDYVHAHAAKVIIALVLTVPISLWIIKNRGAELNHPTSTRKIAIVLAIFLGWLGGHRFYLGQIGWGIVYLIIFYLFTPLVVIISLIDAIRYLFMSDEEFTPGRVPAR